MAPKFKVGDLVETNDAAKYQGIIYNVVHHKGGHWYEVRLPGGIAVRHDNELTAK